MVQTLYNHSESEAEIFWAEYSKLENRRFQNLKKEDELESRWSWQYIWEVAFLQRIPSGGGKTEYEPIGFIPKIIYWIGRSWRRENYEDETNDKSFVLFFLGATKLSAMVVISLSIIILAAIVGVINAASGTNEWQPSYVLVSWSNIYIAEWFVVLVVCYSFFIINAIPIEIRRQYRIDAFEIWTNIGNFILCLRVLKLLRPISSTLIKYAHQEIESHCFGLQDFSGGIVETRFFVVMNVLVVDFIMSSVLSVLPFQWPWIFYYVSIMILHTCIRLHTCESVLGFPHAHIVGIRCVIFTSVTLNYIGVVAIASYSYLRSMKSSYLNSRYQTQLAQDAKKMVDLLCSDVKLIVRSTLKTYDEICSLTKNQFDSVELQKTMTLSANVLQHAIDMMLYLVKVGEGRHRVVFSEHIRLDSLITAEVLRFGDAIKLYSQGQERIDVRLEVPNCLIVTDSTTISALVYYGLSVVYTLYRIHFHASKQDTSSFLLEFQFSTKYELIPPENHHKLEDRLPQGHQLCRLTITITQTKRDSVNEIRYIEALHPFIQALNTILACIVSNYAGEYTLFEDHVSLSITVAMDTTCADNRKLFPQLDVLPKAPVLPSLASSTASYVDVHIYRTAVATSAVNNSQLASFLHQHCSIFSTIPAVEPLLLDLINQFLSISSGNTIPITIWHEINLVDIKIRSVIFVQTKNSARILRDAGYRRMIVLCSEKLAYLDAPEMALFDFVISLPSSIEELSRLRQFLERLLPVEDHAASSSSSSIEPSSGEHNDDATSSDNQFQSNESAMRSVITLVIKFVFSVGEYFQTVLYGWCNSLFLVDLPSNLFESYTKWRFLNPGNDIYHHSTNIEYISFLVIINTVISYISGYLSVGFLVVTILSAMILFFRRSFHRFLSAYISLSTLWKSGSYLIAFGISLTILAEIVRIVLNPDISFSFYSLPKQSLLGMLEKYPSTSFQTGKQALAVLLAYPISLRYNGEFFPWPFSLGIRCFLYLRGLLILHFYILPLMYGWQFIVLLFIVILFFTVTLLYHYESEKRFRVEFLQLYHFISSRYYFDSCLMVTRRVHDGLLSVSRIQAATIHAIVEKVLKENSLVGNVLCQHLHVIRYQQAILTQLCMELRGADTSIADFIAPLTKAIVSYNYTPMMLNDFKLTPDELVAQLCAAILRPIVHSICATFGSSFSIPSAIATAPSALLFVRIDPEVFLVRTDISLLRYAITKLLREAYRHIEEYSIRSNSRATVSSSKSVSSVSSHGQGRKHQILVWIKASTTSAAKEFTRGHVNQPPAPVRYRFADVRRMDILCLHSAKHDTHQKSKSSPFNSYQGVHESPIILHKSLSSSSQYSSSSMHPINKYLSLFPLKLPDSTSSNARISSQYDSNTTTHHTAQRFHDLFEEGWVEGHATYQSYQRYSLPYMLTPRSERFVEIAKLYPATLQVSAEIVRPLSASYFPLYRTIYLQHMVMLWKQPIVLGEMSANDKQSNSANATSGPTGKRPIMPRFTGRCSLYCQPYGFLNTFERSSLLTLMKLTQWVVMHYHPSPLPPISSYQHSECIFIEYHSTDVSTKQSSSLNHNNSGSIETLIQQRRLAWQADEASTYAYDPLEIMHFVRLEGFVGVIVILLPSTLSAQEEIEIRKEVEYNNIYREAVRAELCIKLPLDSEKIGAIVSLCERRLVELSLSIFE